MASPCRICDRENTCESKNQACNDFRVWVRRVMATARRQTGLTAKRGGTCAAEEPATEKRHEPKPVFRWIERKRGS